VDEAIKVVREEYAKIAKNAMTSRIIGGPGAVGKSMAQTIIYSDSIMRNLNTYYQKNDPKNAASIVSLESIVKGNKHQRRGSRFHAAAGSARGGAD